MGFLHHSVYLVYFEMGRTELMRERGLVYADMEADGRYVTIAHVDCRYRTPARYDDRLAVDTDVLEVRGARVVFGSRVLRPEDGGETLIAEATVTGALIGPDGRPRRFPQAERRLLLGLSADAEPRRADL